MRQKTIHDFQTGNLVVAAVSSGKKAGIHRGSVAVRASSNCNIQTPLGIVDGVSHLHCHIIQRADGYGYHFQKYTSLSSLADGVSAHRG